MYNILFMMHFNKNVMFIELNFINYMLYCEIMCVGNQDYLPTGYLYLG